jgi:hypothetical protein
MLPKSFFTVIQKGDEKKFKSMVVNKKRIASLIESFTGKTKREKGLKAELKNENIKALADDTLTSYQKLLKEGRSFKDASFSGYEEKQLKLMLPNFTAYDLSFRIRKGNEEYVIHSNVIITRDDFYLMGLEYTHL